MASKQSPPPVNRRILSVAQKVDLATSKVIVSALSQESGIQVQSGFLLPTGAGTGYFSLLGFSISRTARTKPDAFFYYLNFSLVFVTSVSAERVDNIQFQLLPRGKFNITRDNQIEVCSANNPDIQRDPF